MSIKQKMQPVSLLERTLDGKPITLIMDMTQVAYATLVLKIIQYSRSTLKKIIHCYQDTDYYVDN